MYSKLELQEVLSNSVFTLRIADNSYYISGAGNNAILEITPPGASCAVIFEVEAEFNTSFNSFTLGLIPNDTYSETTPLPDGVYKIKYSVAPNDQVYVEYNLFKNTSLLSEISQSICKLIAQRKRISSREYDMKTKDLYWIKNLADASKWLVEYSNGKNGGIELYNECKSLLTKYNGGTQCH